ncbi:MAG: hypothetical protein Q8L51_03545 [Candidatus Amesbacteria bacterium]|nr:hypothetical protein [Candidatus Amesbacteria bacterium]
MFALAVSIGILSYALMALGLLGILSNETIFIVAVIYLCTSPLWFPSPKLGEGTKRRGIILFGIVIIQALINLIGALGPELGFDALWYHLPIPQNLAYQSQNHFLGR